MYVLAAHSDLDFRIVSKKDFQTSFWGQGHLIAWHLKMLMDGFCIIKSRILLFGTKCAKNEQENTTHFWGFFSFCPFYGQKMQEKVSKSSNADKNGLGEYLAMNFRHFLLSCIPFWLSSDFLDNIRASRSLCSFRVLLLWLWILNLLGYANKFIRSYHKFNKLLRGF